MLRALKRQIEDIHAGSTAKLSVEYGHAIATIAQVGRDEALCGEGTEEAQIKRMKDKATDEVIKYGPKILDHLRPELRALIEPEDLPELEKEHEMFLTKRAERK